MTEPTVELLPCPFCGALNPLELGNIWEERFKFTCVACKCVGPAYRTLPEAIEAWNTRTPDPATKAKVELLEEAMRHLKLALELLREQGLGRIKSDSEISRLLDKYNPLTNSERKEEG